MTKLLCCMAGSGWPRPVTSSLIVFTRALSIAVIFAFSIASICAQTRHSSSSRYPSYNGLVMCGYQGWFRAPEDGAHEGWGHYAVGGKFDAANVHLDFWPDVDEYPKTYSTTLTNQN